MLEVTVALANGSGAQTDTALISAPGAGKHIEVWGLYISAEDAVKFTLEHGSTAMFNIFLGANGGADLPAEGRGAPLNGTNGVAPTNTAVTYTTSAAADVYFTVFYRIVTD